MQTGNLVRKKMSSDTVDTLGTLKTPIIFNNWHISPAKITVIAEGFRFFLTLFIRPKLGITITQKPCHTVEINNVDPPCAIKQSPKFPQLITQIGKSKHQTVNSKFQKKIKWPTKKKEQRVPIHFQRKIEIELEQFLCERHLENICFAYSKNSKKN